MVAESRLPNIVSALSTYLSEKHEQLADNYQADCLAIACDVARLLVESGKQPSIVSFTKTTKTEDGNFHHPLMPKKYGGRVTFTRHYVCCCEELAYEPMLEQPVPIEQLCQAVFGQELTMEEFVSADGIETYLDKRRV